MRIVAISGIYAQQSGLALPDGDVLIHSGNWSDSGSEEDAIKFLTWLQSRPQSKKIFIAGNRDFIAEKQPDLLLDLIDEYANDCIYLNHDSVIINNKRFFGSPCTPCFFDQAFNAKSGSEIKTARDTIPTDTDILITHGPASKTLDLIKPNHDLKGIIKTWLPHLKAHFFGHIYEGYGVHEDKRCCYINSPIVIDI